MDDGRRLAVRAGMGDLDYPALLDRAIAEAEAADPLCIPNCAKGRAKVVAQDGLRMRDAPSVDGAIVGDLVDGQEVTVWACDPAGWWIVQTDDGLTGWSSSRYLRAVGTLVP